MAIYVDADACPVKEETYRVARRHGVKVFVVANTSIRVPAEDLIEGVLVKGGFDVADDWIVERIGEGDVAITTDIPLAGRCLEKGARVLGPKGHVFTEDAIGEALATRALLDMLRQSGEFGGGPAPFAKADRSRFLAKLDETLHAVRRRRKG
ncbi:MAG TPA: YaiI/YqxD family protein [Isosphaeraceae bacterium]